MKDHEIAELINQVRDVAKEFGQTQQLRERLASILVPILKGEGSVIASYTQMSVVVDGCIEPTFDLPKGRYTSGYLKYFQEYEGKPVRVALEFFN